MIVPPEVAQRSEEMSDQEILDAYVRAGFSEGYARVCLDQLRGRRVAPEGLPSRL